MNARQFLALSDIHNMFLVFCSHIIHDEHKINTINVFPVPDKDTGTNLLKTFQPIHKGLSEKKYLSMRELLSYIENTALLSAQGNSGIIFTGFLSGFFKPLKQKEKLTLKDLSNAFLTGASKARSSIENPQEGTILDIMDDVAYLMNTTSFRSVDHLLKASLNVAHNTLIRTTDKMNVLKQSHVVDAGALGFVVMLESFCESVTSEVMRFEIEEPTRMVQQSAQDITDHRYEVVTILEEFSMPKDLILEMLSPLGNSLDVIEVDKRIKVHIHTDVAETVKELLYSLGTVVFFQLMDMKEERTLECNNSIK